ncbi:MAG: DUF2997 domain-containing protein [Verrucomicrobiae bacterium]|nr:DUF2997 domain-containing protein [Verrucomicrobiae bacterium]
MKSKPHIDVWISPEGAITIDAVGYSGNSCEEATRFLETELGTIGRKQRTRDWYRPNTTRTPNSLEQTS